MTALKVDCWSERTFEFEPEKTALLVIDMQRHFLEYAEDGDQDNEVGAGDSEADAEQAPKSEDDEDAMDPPALIENVGRLVSLARRLGCHIVHTREGYSADLSDVSGFRRDLDYVGHPGPLGRTLVRGELGHDFVAALKPLPGEPVIDKASFGAFFRTSLDEQLRATGVERLILCGVTTQCCVHSTLREAVDHGYWCLTVADCCAASEPGLHEAALMLIIGEGHLFGWITELADLEVLGSTSIAGA